MVENYINEELSFIERKMLFKDVFKEKVLKFEGYSKWEEALIIYKILFFNKFESSIPISRNEIYKHIELIEAIEKVKSISSSAFYMKYQNMDIYFIFEPNKDKIKIKCTNKIVNNIKEYDEIGFLDDLFSIKDNFYNSLQEQIESVIKTNKKLDDNIKLLTNMIE